ncbi:hypothetical protein ACIBAC_00480 [Streptomyces sp. NPDC051362]|uniref:hypothetical protein n=1 Tax=Streptomyces sp. NPDC051362 TaxID=3365651 RepID=UPI0037B4BA64
MTSPAAAPAPSADIDAALMNFPYQQWIGAPAAAGLVQDVGLPRELLRLVIRSGRRRGVLTTRRDPDQLGFFVMRVADTCHRTAAVTV